MNDREWNTLIYMQVDEDEVLLRFMQAIGWWRIDAFEIYVCCWITMNGIFRDLCKWMDDRGLGALRYMQFDGWQNMMCFKTCLGRWW